MKSGEILVECAIDTDDSTKVADVAWASEGTFKIIKEEASCSVAPEICVEAISPFNSDEEMTAKQQLYLRAGAKEFWICDERGHMEFLNAAGPLAESLLCPSFPKQLPI